MEGNTEIQRPQQELLKPESQSLASAKKSWLEQLRDGVNRGFQREQKPVEPRMSINIFCSLHGSGKDLEGLEEQFQKADIYIPENFGWRPEYLDLLQSISNGKRTPRDALEEWNPENPRTYSRDKRFYEILYKSQKPIAFIDVPEGHSIVKRDKKISRSPNIEWSSFVERLESTKRYLQDNATVIKEREEYIRDRLKPQIQKLLKAYPNLRKKQEINILLSLGRFHTSLYHSLKEDYQATRIFNKTPFIFGFGEEAMRRYMFNKHVDDELVARVTIERDIFRAYGNLFRELTYDTEKTLRVRRTLVLRFSFDEIRNMSEEVKDLDDWKNMFARGLAKKGLRIPTSEKDLDEFLAKPLPRSESAQK